jgi:hypothetical protein
MEQLHMFLLKPIRSDSSSRANLFVLHNCLISFDRVLPFRVTGADVINIFVPFSLWSPNPVCHALWVFICCYTMYRPCFPRDSCAAFDVDHVCQAAMPESPVCLTAFAQRCTLSFSQFDMNSSAGNVCAFPPFMHQRSDPLCWITRDVHHTKSDGIISPKLLKQRAGAELRPEKPGERDSGLSLGFKGKKLYE